MNLSLSPTWAANVYRLDAEDPVLGFQNNANGISNLQAEQLGNRTEWLKEHVDALLAGNMQLKSVVSYSSNQTLTATNTGGLVVLTGTTPITMTLPDVTGANALLDNQAIVFKNKNTSAGCIVKTTDSDGTSFDGGGYSIKLRVDDVLMIIRKGNTYYTVHTKSRGVPAGTVTAYAGICEDLVPPDGWLICDGSTVSKSTYAELYLAIGDTYNNGGVPVGTFRLPDLRGEFIRGLDAGRGVDNLRTLGSAQGGDIQAHTHSLSPLKTNQPSNTNAGSALAVTGAGTVTATTASSGGTETRPRNVALWYLIKA